MDSASASLDTMQRARVGRSLGFTLYAQCGPGPDKADTYLGVCNDIGIAGIVVDALNGARRPGVRWRALGRLVYSAGFPIGLDDFLIVAVTPDVAARMVVAVTPDVAARMVVAVNGA